MTLPDYLADVAKEMRLRSAAIRRDFATHKPTAGGNREDLVRRFLEEHLPRQFGVDTGLIISTSGQFSRQADLVVVDRLSNAPLYGSLRSHLWPVEAVYALLEVKTHLSPSDISDAVEKCRQFKRLPRAFMPVGDNQRIHDSIFALWGYDGPEPETLLANLLTALKDVPVKEQPDFVVIPDHFVARSGEYLTLATLGQPGSDHWERLREKHGADLSSLIPRPVVANALGDYSLMEWFIYFDSWLRGAGSRTCRLLDYLPPNRDFGRAVEPPS